MMFLIEKDGHVIGHEWVSLEISWYSLPTEYSRTVFVESKLKVSSTYVDKYVIEREPGSNTQ